MDDKIDGGPAFPSSGDYCDPRGMTLRDWFAGMALAGYCDTDLPFSPDGAAERCYSIADAMLVERARKETNDGR